MIQDGGKLDILLIVDYTSTSGHFKSSQSDVIQTEVGQTTPHLVQTIVTIVTIVSPVKCLEGALYLLVDNTSITHQEVLILSPTTENINN